MLWGKYPYFKGLKCADFKGRIKNLERGGKMSNNSYFRNAVTWRKTEVKVDRGDHWTGDYASPFFVPLFWGIPCKYLAKESSTVGSIFCAHIFCNNSQWHLCWIAAPTPLCCGTDQNLCDICRRFPRHTENLLGVELVPLSDGSQKTVRIRYFQSWFPVLVLASWLTAPKASPETIHEPWSQMGCGNTNTCVSCVITICGE